MVERSLAVRRNQQRDLLAAVLPIDAEVGVQRQHGAAGDRLTHAYQTGICQRHGNIAVAANQGSDPFVMLVQTKPNYEEPAEHLQDGLPCLRKRSQQMEGLSDNRLAGEQRRTNLRYLLLGPRVVVIAPVQERHEWPGIHKNSVDHRPKPSMCLGLYDRSPGPSTQPIRSAAASRNDPRPGGTLAVQILLEGGPDEIRFGLALLPGRTFQFSQQDIRQLERNGLHGESPISITSVFLS